MTRSGWCGLHVPAGHVSHSRCRIDGCPCDCHTKTPAAEDAPGGGKASGSELTPSAAGPQSSTLFSARSAPGAVILITDPTTAQVLAGLLERAYVASELSDETRPLWMWDVAALRRAATNAAHEATETRRVDVGFTPHARLQLVAGGGTS